MSEESRLQAQAQLGSLMEYAAHDAGDCLCYADCEDEYGTHLTNDEIVDGARCEIGDGYDFPQDVSWVDNALSIDTVRRIEILLTTGGGAVRAYGIVTSDGDIRTVGIEHQDWFEAWLDLPLTAKEYDHIHGLIENVVDWGE